MMKSYHVGYGPVPRNRLATKQIKEAVDLVRSARMVRAPEYQDDADDHLEQAIIFLNRALGHTE